MSVERAIKAGLLTAMCIVSLSMFAECAMREAHAGVPLTEINFTHRTDAGDNNLVKAVPAIEVLEQFIFATINNGGSLDPAKGRTDTANSQDGWRWGDAFAFADDRDTELDSCITNPNGLGTIKLAGQLANPLQIMNNRNHRTIGLRRTWQYGLSGAVLNEGMRVPVSVGGSDYRTLPRGGCTDNGHGGWVVMFPEPTKAYSVTFVINMAFSAGRIDDTTRNCDIFPDQNRVHFRSFRINGSTISHMDVTNYLSEDGCLLQASFVTDVETDGLEIWLENGRDLGVMKVAIGQAVQDTTPDPEPTPDPSPDPEPCEAPDTTLLDQCVADLLDADALLDDIHERTAR